MKKIIVYGLTKNIGGLEMFTAKTILNMDTTDVEVHMLVHEKTIFYEELTSMGVIFHFVSRRGKNPFKNIKEVEEVFKKNDFYAIWMNACTLTYITPLIMAKKYGVKVRSIHAHSTSITKGMLMGIFHSINKMRISKYANLYLGCTKEASKFLAPKHIVENNEYIVIKNAIELEKYIFSEENRRDIRQEFNIDKQAFVVGNIGHLIDVKNHNFLIDIFLEINKDIPNSYLIIVGVGELEDKLKEKVSKLDIEKKVIFAGKRNDVNILLSAFDVFVMTSKFEGLPLVAVEAQASGLMTFLSDKISEESKLTDSVNFIDLESGEINWKDKIISKSKCYTRRNNIKVLEDKGFSIKKNTKYLKKLLLENNSIVFQSKWKL